MCSRHVLTAKALADLAIRVLTKGSCASVQQVPDGKQASEKSTTLHPGRVCSPIPMAWLDRCSATVARPGRNRHCALGP